MSKDRVYGHTRSGQPITAKEIEALVTEADGGYDVDALLARRGRRGFRHLHTFGFAGSFQPSSLAAITASVRFVTFKAFRIAVT